MPVRKLKKSYQNVTGMFYSNKLRRLVQFDSILEHDFIEILDIHPSVKWFAEQPMKIRLRDPAGAPQVYVPDFHIVFSGRRFLGRNVSRPWIIETKYRRDLCSDWQRIGPKIRAGVREAQQLRATFHVLTDQHVSGVALSNAKFLRRFRNSDISPDAMQSLVQHVRQLGPTTVANLASRFLVAKTNGITAEHMVWIAVSSGLVFADIEEPLGPETIVWGKNSR